ncbi:MULTISPECIES: nitric oxide synthase oxygenase [Staphylococcus]|uniref:nitric oxide synthase oxygenase n=1 Tax=Staphylococcus TaxID=1279 RepID=UPI000D1A1F07|nr:MULTISPECIES: nitric oxide synthase oxygenase [Staphylococcus]MDT0693926.1 nitric oxide synthase oxygenase [Staphylococcus chromogenes]MDT0716631.1 nitric oxide synthase oxygenase [Staphylococcus chromogenes]MDT0736438.1 nitric oxide synthase oxygenase [Staphylococcus chromogenes]MDT0741208.1 nitric oxide synthase oxygenase [Staphylococcus chromogenes]MDT0748428.1 nitric oxide synthase oxygenase [Staphylococcus chromogenes]
MLKEAISFITQYYEETNQQPHQLEHRLNEVKQEIKEKGFYRHTTEELTYGARLAWRNSNRCIGRLFWENLKVQDARDIQDESSFLNAITHHIEAATNDGKIVPYITIFGSIFDSTPKIYNNQLIRYAGYETKGDPSERKVTQLAEHLGWRSNQTDFDILPLIYQLPGDKIKYYDYPKSLILEVPIHHHAYPKVEQLQLKWYAVPIISNMDLKIGGITYPTVPFNGWYMVNEIAVRNFLDTYRYNLLEPLAEAMNFTQLRNSSFNKDRVVVEINDAVYQSFKDAGVSMVDHLTAAKQFEKFEAAEHEHGRTVTGKWSWLAPPLSPTLTANYHHGYDNTMRETNFYYKQNTSGGCPFH